MSPAWKRSAGLWDGHLSLREVHQGAVLEVFDCKSTCVWLAALGLELRFGVLRIRWLRSGTCVWMPCRASLVVAGPFTDSRPRTRVGALTRACPLLADRASIPEIFAKARHADTLRMGCTVQRSDRGTVAGLVSGSYTVTQTDQRTADRAIAATSRHTLQTHATHAGRA